VQVRQVLLAVALIIILLVLTGGVLAFLAERHPFQPGHLLFGWQRLAEELPLRLARDRVRQADIALDLANRRLEDLAAAQEAGSLTTAAAIYQESLDRAIGLAAGAPEVDRDRLQGRLDDLLLRTDMLITQLLEDDPALEENPRLLALQTRVEVFTEVEESEVTPTDQPPAPLPIDGAAVSFLGQDIDHSFFPLDGGHATTCETCHTSGAYEGTPAECAACHTPPAEHFPGACSDCHLIADWTPFQFNHTGVTECASCHAADEPADHFDGACESCHQPDTWQTVTFDHTGFTDCVSCHTSVMPVGHFPGQCSSCHNTIDWGDASFDHAGIQQECIACHAEPAVHAGLFGLDCARCHTVTAWTPAQLTSHTFPLDHGSSVALACETCHTDTYTTYTCYNCHEHVPADIRDEHVDEGINDFEDCVACHPTGREDEAEDD